MLMWLLLFLFIVCLISRHSYFYWTEKQRLKIINQIPGPPLKSIIGNILDFPRKPEEFWNRIRTYGKLYYPIYRLWGVYIASVNLLCPEDIELILSNTKHTVKSSVYRCLYPWLGSGLLTSSGIKWYTRRKILTHAFHFTILQKFVPIFCEQSKLLIELLENEVDKSHTEIGIFISQFALNTICGKFYLIAETKKHNKNLLETAMGVRLNNYNKKENEYKNAIYRIGKVLVYRISRPWLALKFIYKLTSKYQEERKLINILHQFTTSIIKKRETNFKLTGVSSSNKSQNRLVMLDLLISIKNKEGLINDDGIREEVDTFMFEGHDTIATSLTFTLMLLAYHKDVQDKILQEMQEVRSNFDDYLTYTELQNLNYLERVLKESLRMFPSVPFIGRVTGEEVKTFTGYTIPAKCCVNIHIYDLHYNSKIYPDPYKFDPDRFLPKYTRTRHPYAYLPFSAGPRNCIGQKFALLELKCAIISILRKYVLEAVHEPSQLLLSVDMVLRTTDNIKIKIRRRF